MSRPKPRWRRVHLVVYREGSDGQDFGDFFAESKNHGRAKAEICAKKHVARVRASLTVVGLGVDRHGQYRLCGRARRG